MTERQLRGFHAAAQRLDAARRADAIEDMASAIAAALGDKEARQLPQQLRRVK